MNFQILQGGDGSPVPVDAAVLAEGLPGILVALVEAGVLETEGRERKFRTTKTLLRNSKEFEKIFFFFFFCGINRADCERASELARSRRAGETLF